jgi:hypothetical protein
MTLNMNVVSLPAIWSPTWNRLFALFSFFGYSSRRTNDYSFCILNIKYIDLFHPSACSVLLAAKTAILCWCHFIAQFIITNWFLRRPRRSSHFPFLRQLTTVEIWPAWFATHKPHHLAVRKIVKNMNIGKMVEVLNTSSGWYCQWKGDKGCCESCLVE